RTGSIRSCMGFPSSEFWGGSPQVGPYTRKPPARQPSLPPGLTGNPGAAKMKAHHDGTPPIASEMGGGPGTPRADLAGRRGLPAHKGVIEVAEILDDAGVIRSRVGFVLLALARGSFRGLKAGEYQIPAGSNTVRVLEQIAGGQVLQHMLVFPEGSTLGELARLLQTERLVSAEDILRVGKDPVFLKTLDVQADSVEGYLFPDTYQFVKGMTPEEILARMVARMREKISP